MDKKELKQDLVRDRIIDFIQYLSEKSLNVLIILVVLVAGISAYGFLSNKEAKRLNLSSELSGLAQNEYNQGDAVFAIDDLEGILDDYEKTHGGTQAYIYLIYDAYINSDTDKLKSLLDDYSVYSDDLFLKSSVLETKSYLALNEGDYSSAIELLNKSLKINNIKSIGLRLSIAKARVYIQNEEYNKANDLLLELKEEGISNNSQKNIVDELVSYINHKKS